MTSKVLSKRKKAPKGPPQSELADRHVLYQKSVQAPEFELEFFVERFKQFRKRTPHSMREDFCGTAHLSTHWCTANRHNTAIGVDLCSDTLAWAQQHNLAPAGKAAERVSLRNENVLTVQTEPADLVCAMNFSYCTFKTRDLMRQYFENARRGLKEDGILFLDLMGGTQTIDTIEEEREIDDEDFVYVWEQAKYNPVTNEILCHIHFDFPDGSRMKNAFTYDWRLWSIQELRELALEAGFKGFHVFWEEFAEDEDDPDSEYLVGTGVYREVKEVEQQDSWLAYIVVLA